MKTPYLILMIALFATCNAQEVEKNTAPNKGADEFSEAMPKASWRVNKEFDEQGNVTGYDSTYTWSYSTFSGDSVDVDVDSMMTSFDRYFNQRMPSLWGPAFKYPFRQDSGLHPDFFRHDYFHDRWSRNLYDMDRMFHQMDSMRNRFFQHSYPGMMPEPKADEE